jgi:glycosyltransferase involved in cell wall biosynthesis
VPAPEPLAAPGPAGSGGAQPDLDRLVGEVIECGVRRVHVLAWRDLDDPDAGGSEVHADEFMRRWASAGLDIVHRTSAGEGIPAEARRNGYGVIRRGSRYSVFPRTAVSELAGRMGRSDALIEIWNGVPWFSPLWYRRSNMTIVHHIHGPMWDQIMPGPLAGAGRLLEARIAPPFYRRAEVVTPSEGTRDELIELGFRPDRVTAVDNGVDPYFSPGGQKSAEPVVVAAARLAPVKRLGLLLEAAEEARRSVADLRLRIIGDGPLRPELESWVTAHGAGSWVELPGRIDRVALRDEYRRAWVVASASLAEGWGLTLTEAAACGTPAVATAIRGHRCSVVDGVTGVLAPPAELGRALAGVLTDHERRDRLGAAALARARSLTWDASALGVLRVFHRVVAARGRAAGAEVGLTGRTGRASAG